MSYSIPKRDVVSYEPEALGSFHTYIFEWVDNLHFLGSPAEFIGSDVEAYLSIARDRFSEMGWEGDGEIRLLWLPPFVFPFDSGVKPEGLLLWHVKQQEDGVSFILSPMELPFQAFQQ